MASCKKYAHQDPIPSIEDVYAQLYEEFPNYIKKVKYEEPIEEETDSEDELDPDEDLNPEEANLQEDTSDLFMNKIGYEITKDDQKVRDRIRASKDKIYEEAIDHYVKNTSNKIIYLKYSEGNYAQVSKAEDLKTGGKVWFSGADKTGNPVDGYVIMNDIDFKGASVGMADEFSGKIIGNGHSLKNITISVNSRKMDKDTSKALGLFKKLDGAYIENLTFEGTNIKMNINSGIPVTAAPLAAEAKNSELKNIKFKDLTIDTGKGDDGAATYRIGDVFAVESGNKLEDVTGENITINASDTAEINSLLTN